MATETLERGTSAPGGAGLRRLLLENGALAALLVLVVALSVLSGSFLTASNLLNVGVQAAVDAILAFGVTFVIVSAGIDLSVGSVAALSATVLAWLATHAGVPVWLAVVVSIATGIASGLVSGTLISFGKLPPFIATLAMLSVGRGLAMVISQGSPIAFPGSVSALGDTIGGWLPVPVLVMVAMGVVTAIVLGRTYAGRSMYAIGGNEEAARLSGIRVRRQKLVIYALSGLFAAIAGIVLASRLASAQPDAADGYELDAIAAVVIGGASLSGGKGKASGTFIGALILAVLRNGLNLLNVSSFWQQVVIGVVIALAVLLDTLRRRNSVRTATPGATGSPRGGGNRLRTNAIGAVAVVAAIGLVIGVNAFRSGSNGRTRIGLTLSTLNDPFFVSVRAGAQAEAKAEGVDLTVTDADNDASSQADQVSNFLSQSDQAIILNPVDSNAAAPSAKLAAKSKVPVIAVDRGVTGAPTTSLVASDNVAGGELAAKALAAQLGGKGTIVVLQGTAGTSAAQEREQGFKQGIAAYPGIRIVAEQPADFDRTKGLDVMGNLLQAHPDINGVFAANDEMALGAIKALGSKAGKTVKVVGFDGEKDGLAAVKAGTEAADVAQRPSQLGKLAVENAMLAIKGKKVPGDIKVPVEVVTAKNVAGFKS
ncbi:substrate-binding domain-containing protein [Streptantibioticus parmotrematis]|uniref:ABC transporter permease/substrate-binding protein n=1 Tax=Streptantibioticus parmotrematis TaxID=2873249 RepID=UPI0033CEF774